MAGKSSASYSESGIFETVPKGMRHRSLLLFNSLAFRYVVLLWLGVERFCLPLARFCCKLLKSVACLRTCNINVNYFLFLKLCCDANFWKACVSILATNTYRDYRDDILFNHRGYDYE